MGETRFWEDWWVDDKPLKEAYPSLYAISNDREITVRGVIEKGWNAMSFKRNIDGGYGGLWDSLKRRCEDILMHGGRDKPMWMLNANRIFTVKSLYLHLVRTDMGFPHTFLWKVKVPAKIKFFLWLLSKKSILTRDTLLKRGWKGDKHCVFCGQEENIDHLFFSYSVARIIWNLVRCSFDF